jgi:fluoride exporter
MLNLLLIFVGGGIGCLSRYGVSRMIMNTSASANFPWATLISNIISVLVMGLALGLFASRMQNESLRALVIVGFCGGFSTFSTFSFETLELFRRGNYLFAAGNIVLSISLCIFILAVLTKRTA